MPNANSTVLVRNAAPALPARALTLSCIADRGRLRPVRKTLIVGAPYGNACLCIAT